MDIRDVEKLAELSRILLAEEEKSGMLKDMQEIVEYVKTIEGVEVGDVDVEYTLRNVWREDEAEPREFSKDLILNQFPDSKGGFLKVKKIL